MVSDFTRNTEIEYGSAKNFGEVFAILFAALALWPLIGGGEIGFLYLVIAAAFYLISLIKPTLFRVPSILWNKLGIFIGKLISPIILGAMYFTIFTPLGLLLKLMRKDLINIKFERERETYWDDRKDPIMPMKSQF